FQPEAVWQDLEPKEFLIESWLGGGVMPGFAWLTPRWIIDKAGIWNERLTLNDDGEFFARVVMESKPIVFCEDARGFYRSGIASSLTGRTDAEAWASAFLACELSCSHLLQRDQTPRAQRACAAAYLRFAYAAYPNVPSLVRSAEQRARQFGGCSLKPQ